MVHSGTPGQGPSELANSPIVYVVDDHQAMCESIEALLSGRGYLVECFVDPSEFVLRAEKLASGLVLLDLRMPSMSGLQVLAAIKPHLRRLPVVMITGHGEIEDAVKAIKAGAKDFIQKPFKSELLIDILEKEWSALNAHVANADGRADLDQLSPRERDVVMALANGRPNKVIAHELGISVRTVEMHRARAMQRLGCKTFADLLRVIFKEPGLGSSPDQPATTAK